MEDKLKAIEARYSHIQAQLAPRRPTVTPLWWPSSIRNSGI